MLEALRRGSQGIVVKLLMAILILSFAVWGVADVVTRIGHTALAEVGDTEITPDEYQRAFQTELNAISYRAGRRITAEQARAFGLDRQVMNRLIGWAAVDAEANKLKLALSNEKLVEGLQRDPAFHGSDGKYSRAALDEIIRQLGLSEAGFLALRRKEELRRQLTTALTQAVVVPEAMVETTNAWREESRTIAHFDIDADKIVKVEAADEAKLKATYESHKTELMTPPLRKLAVMVLSMEEMKKRMSISDEEAKAAYEAEKASYDVPEKRRVQQISFPDKATAEAALKAIEGGKSFEDVAKEAGAKDTDIDLGLITKAQLIDPKIAEAAYALAKDGVSQPVEGRFTTALLRVTAIEPGTASTFDQVRTKVLDKLAGERAKIEIRKVHGEVDDGRAAGLPLKDIAAQSKLQFLEVAATDRDGKAPDGKAALEIPDAQRIVTAAFAGQMGVEQDPVDLSDGGLAWVDVIGITPAAEQAFDQVKEKVVTIYEKTERDRQIKELADKLVARLAKGETMEQVAADAGSAKVSTTQPIKRTTTPQGLSRTAVAQAFALTKGAAASAESANGSTRTVLHVKDVIAAPAPSKEQVARISKEIEGNLENDAVAAYVTALQQQMGVSINQAEFDKLRGANTP
ncbi:MAG: SurA N-terminal domain-containing protein [Hyphomicrobiaceae bacterium]|nr:SurA N-terminal domain-containing protein [Hyphomicrobiaceae bacterium]